MKTFLVILSSLLFIAGTIPYLVGVIKRRVKPKIVTWLIWTLLTSISLAAAISDGQYTTTALLSCSAISTTLVVVFGWKYGYKKFERLDGFCLTGAIIGIILWQIFNSPGVAVLASIVIDIIGAVPTLAHAWNKPEEEAWISFYLSFMGAFCTLLTLDNYAVTAFAYPLYLFCSNLAFSTVILARRRAKRVEIHN